MKANNLIFSFTSIRKDDARPQTTIIKTEKSTRKQNYEGTGNVLHKFSLIQVESRCHNLILILAEL